MPYVLNQKKGAKILRRLHLGNFKAFSSPIEINFKKITLIFGSNSSGKSSIIHSLLFLDEFTKNSASSWPHDIYSTKIGGEAVDFGGYPHFVHRHDPKQVVTIEFETVQSNGNSKEITHSHTTELKLFSFEPSMLERLFSHDGYVFKKSKHMRVLSTDGRKIASYENDFSPALWNPLLQKKPQYRGHKHFSTKVHIEDDSIIGDLFRKIYTRVFEEFFSLVEKDRELFLLLSKDTKKVTTEIFTNKKYEAIFVKSLFNALDRTDLGTYTFTDYLPVNVNLIEYIHDTGMLSSKCIHTAFFNVIKAFHEFEYTDIDRTLNRFSSKWRELYKSANPIQTLHDLSKSQGVIANNFLVNLRYIAPLRKIPARGSTGNSSIDFTTSDGGGIWTFLLSDARITSLVNDKLKQLNINYKLLIQMPSQLLNASIIDSFLRLTRLSGSANPHVELIDTNTNTIVSHRDVGVGVSQVLPILVNAFAETNATICIEQPELHLHPRLQGDLADIFIDTSVGSEQNNSYIIETHSEHIIRRLMRRVREGKISKDDISIVYVEPGPNGSTVTQIHLDDDGDLIDDWPNGFFEEGFRDHLAGRQ